MLRFDAFIGTLLHVDGANKEIAHSSSWWCVHTHTHTHRPRTRTTQTSVNTQLWTHSNEHSNMGTQISCSHKSVVAGCSHTCTCPASAALSCLINKDALTWLSLLPLLNIPHWHLRSFLGFWIINLPIWTILQRSYWNKTVLLTGFTRRLRNWNYWLEKELESAVELPG